MKRLFLLIQIAVFSGTLVLGQAVVPDDWTPTANIDTYQEPMIIHEGAYSCKVAVNGGPSDLVNDVTITGLTGGDSFTIGFWYITSANVEVRSRVDWDNGTGTWGPKMQASDWAQYTQSGTVPAGVTSCNIKIRWTTLAGFTAGEIQYVDEVTFESPTGTGLTVANGGFENWPAPDPEPTNYPSNFRDTAHVLLCSTKWAEDVVGPDFPSGYLVMGAMDGYTAPVPVDGTPVDDDLDWSDGIVAVNREVGMNGYDFTDLEPSTGYTFTIYPYSNSGVTIDYKTDGNPPSASDTTGDAMMIHSEDFEGQTISWSTYNVLGDDEWEFPLFNGKTTAKVDGSTGGVFYENEDWLISPEIDLGSYNNAFFSFLNIRSLDGPLMQLLVSTNYDGSSDPNTATWDDLTSQANWSQGSYQQEVTEDLDLGGYLDETIHIAFKYTSTDLEGVLYKLDNMQVYSYNPNLDITDPNGGETIVMGSPYQITWDYDYLSEQNIAIYLYKGESVESVITSSTPVSSGSFTWYVITGVQQTSDYRIFIETPEGINDFSDDYFTLVEAEVLIADFEADTTIVVVGDSVMFTDFTIGTPTSWSWTFEGGTPGTFEGEVPPYIIYNEAGSWDVTLQVGNGTNTDIIVKQDYINSGYAPVADFEADATTFVAGSFANFASLATGDDLTYNWYFEGGTPESSTDENPQEIYYYILADTTYDVTLTVTNMFGESTMIKEDYIHTIPSGINEPSTSEINLFPNPAHEYFMFSSHMKGELVLHDVTGKVVMEESIEAGSNTINVSYLDDGYYLVVLYLEDSSRIISKIIVR